MTLRLRTHTLFFVLVILVAPASRLVRADDSDCNNVLRVDINGGSVCGVECSGASWARKDVYKYLQDALAAAGPGDCIWIAGGTYLPTQMSCDESTRCPFGAPCIDRACSFAKIPDLARELTFVLDGAGGDITIIGGFAGKEECPDERPQGQCTISGTLCTARVSDCAGDGSQCACTCEDSACTCEVEGSYCDYSIMAAETFLSGNINNLSIPDDNSYHVTSLVSDDAVALLNRLAIVGGLADGAVGVDDGGSAVRSTTTCLSEGPALVMQDCLVANHSNNNRAALDAACDSVMITESAFVHNSNTGKESAKGAAVSVFGGNSEFNSCLFGNNTSSGEAGAVWIRGVPFAVAEFTSSLFLGNTSDIAGGGLWTSNLEELTITDSVFQGNRANGTPFWDGCSDLTMGIVPQGLGGGVFIDGGNVVNVTSTVFECNSATNQGGALWADGVQSTAITGQSSMDFVNNQAMDGGAIWIQGTEPDNLSCASHVLAISDCQFKMNNATYPDCPDPQTPGRGGAIFAFNLLSSTAIPIDIQRCAYDLNSATRDAGAVWIENSNHAVINDSTFTRNKLTRRPVYDSRADFCELGTQNEPLRAAAGLWVDAVEMQAQDVQCNGPGEPGVYTAITNSTFEDNHSCEGCGALWVLRGDVLVEDTVMLRNLGFPAGGFYTGASGPNIPTPHNATFRNCLLAENRAYSTGGAGATFTTNVEMYGMTIANNTSYQHATSGVKFGLQTGPPIGSFATVQDSILWGNRGCLDAPCPLLQPEFQITPVVGLSLSFLDIEDSQWLPCTDCLYVDPNFVGSSYRLRQNPNACAPGECMSPCLDAGSCCFGQKPCKGRPDCSDTHIANPGTTDIDDVLDVKVIDLGYHYPAQ